MENQKKKPAINRWQEYYILKTDSISIGTVQFCQVLYPKSNEDHVR